MMRRLKQVAARAARGEEGMTLVEMLVGMTAATLVIFAAYGAIDAASKLQTRTTGRIDSAERGRSAMETITRDIRAQMCVATKTGANSAPTPAMLWASADGLQFYSSVAKIKDKNKPSQETLPQMRRIEWVQTAATLNAGDANAQPVGKIVESVWQPTNSTPPYTFPTNPTSQATIATDVERVRLPNGTVLPFFQYYGYTVTNGVGRPSTTPFPLVASPANTMNPNGVASVADSNEPKIVLVSVQFAVRPYSQRSTEGGVTNRSTNVVPIYNRVSVRTADPTDPGVSPLCM